MSSQSLFLLTLATAFAASLAIPTFELNCPPGSTFESRFCSVNTVLSVKVKVLANSTFTCTICDGKAIAMGLRKRVLSLRILRTFKGTSLPRSMLPFAFLKVKAIDTFTEGIKMHVGDIYHVNLGPLQTVVGETPATARSIDLCDPPTLWSDLTAEQVAFLALNAETPVC